MAALTSIAAIASAAAAVGGAVNAYKQGKDAKDTARKQSEETKRAGDLAAQERAKAETEAAQLSTSRLSAKNRARQASSLLAKDQGLGGLAAGGKTQLGQ